VTNGKEPLDAASSRRSLAPWPPSAVSGRYRCASPTPWRTGTWPPVSVSLFGSGVTLWKRGYRLAGWQERHWQSLPHFFSFRQSSHPPRWSSCRGLDALPHRAQAGTGGWRSAGLVRGDPPLTAAPIRPRACSADRHTCRKPAPSPGPPGKRRRSPFPRLGTSVREHGVCRNRRSDSSAAPSGRA
jgi:hypothetical protein